jgi:hypothetical protein
MHAAFLAYLLALGAILALGVKTRYLRWGPALVAIFLLIWTDLILTAQLLSLFSALDVMGAYVIVSVAIAALIAIGLRLVPLEVELSFPEFPNPFSPRLSSYLAWFLASTAALALLADLVMAAGLLPANPDSIVYRFPRAYWYLGHGALTHFSNVADPRVLYYPFNGTLLYLPLIHFHLISQAFTLPSLLCWLMIALTSHLFARDFGGPPLFAAATAWMICLTPNVLLQSLSTNDEIIAASALLAGLFFLHRWYCGRQTLDALIGIVGISVSAGSKLHIVFYWPLLVVVAITLAVHHGASVQDIRRWLIGRRVGALGITVVLCGIIAFSFMVYSYVSAGRVTAWEFNDQMLNKPFDWRVALQTVILYAAQIMLTPFADLHVPLSWASRVHHYEAFNQIFSFLFGWVDNGPAYTSASYRFNGINSSSAVAFNEQTIFIGFTWLVAFLAGIRLATRWNDPRTIWPRFHLASLLVWIGAYAASARYIEGFTVYLGYATIVAAPAMVFAFAPVRYLRLDRIRWVLLALVAATHGFFALDIFLTSSPRNLIALVRAPHWPASRGFSVEKSVLDEIAKSKDGVYNRSIAWGQPFWATMFANPQIRQFLASNPDPIPVPKDAPDDPASLQLRYSRYVVMPKPDDVHLHLFIFPQTPAYGHVLAIRIPDMASAGLTWIGDIQFALGPEWAFAAGNRVEMRHAGRDKYVLLPLQEFSDFGRNAAPKIRIPPIVYGLGERDDLKFRFELKIDGKVTAASDWQQAPSVDLATPGLKPGNGVLTIFVRNDSAGGTMYSTDMVLQSNRPILLAPLDK